MKPALSRMLCAAGALADVSAVELATMSGMGITRVSQLRSGARGDARDVRQLLETLGVRSEALIKQLGQLADWSGRDVEESLAALLLSFDPEPSALHDAHARVACDRLTITLSPTSRSQQLVASFFAKAKLESTHGHYKRAGRHHRIFIGDRLRWRGWKGIRLDFNPSRVSPRALEFVAQLLAHSRGIRFTRVDVAVDLQVNLRCVQALGTQSRRAASVWSSEVESIYIGDKNGARSFAIYDKRNDLLRRGNRSPLPADLTRFEARRKKLKLRPTDLVVLENPFRSLRLLWLGGENLSFVDRVLLRLARVVGVPFLARELPKKRFARLQRRLAEEARRRQVPHPRDAFDELWRREAERVLTTLGLS